jgi:hypothetical protein
MEDLMRMAIFARVVEVTTGANGRSGLGMVIFGTRIFQRIGRSKQLRPFSAATLLTAHADKVERLPQTLQWADQPLD